MVPRRKEASRYLELCAAHYVELLSLISGPASVNSLRVLMAAAIATLKGEHIGVTELSASLAIPLSTTSRLVTELRKAGVVVVAKHPRDDRRKTLRIAAKPMDSLLAWARRWPPAQRDAR